MAEKKENNEEAQGVELDAITKDTIFDSMKPVNNQNASEEPAAAEKAADPFARLKKKKVARPREMQKITGKVKKGRKISPRVFLIGCA